MKRHVVICGLGHIGFRSFELLHRCGYRVTAISDKAPEDWKAKVVKAGGVYLEGDARDDALLERAGVADAHAVLAVTDRDLVNVSVAMDARRMNPRARIVCRLYDTTLGPAISEAVGIEKVWSTSELAAPSFLGAAFADGVVARLEHEGTAYLVGEKGGERPLVAGAPDPGLWLSPEPHSAPARAPWLLRPSLAKLRKVSCVMATGVAAAAAVVKTQMGLSWLDAIYFVTTTITTVGYGDISFLNAAPAVKAFGILLELFGAAGLAVFFSAVAEYVLSDKLSSLFGGRPVPRRDHVILYGSSHVGVRLAERLLRADVPVVLLESEDASGFPAEIRRQAALVTGDGRSAATLRTARAVTARALLAVSDDDLENLGVSLAAASRSDGLRAVTRVFDADLGAKLEGRLPRCEFRSVSAAAAPHFVAAVLADGVVSAFRWRDRLLILSTGDSTAEALGAVNVPGSALRLSAVKLL